MTTAELIKAVEALIARLSMPVSGPDAEDGWTTESKAAARDYFVGLRKALSQRSNLPDLGIVRGLDHWGVAGGDLLEEAARVSNAVRRARAL